MALTLEGKAAGTGSRMAGYKFIPLLTLKIGQNKQGLDLGFNLSSLLSCET